MSFTPTVDCETAPHRRLAGQDCIAIAPSDSVRVVENMDGAVLLDIRQGLCLSVTAVGIKIWNLLRRGYSLERATDCLSAEFRDVAREQIERDVIEYVADLGSKGLLLSSRDNFTNAHRIPRLLRLIQWLRQCRVSKRNVAATSFLWLKALLALFIFDLFRFGTNFTRIHSFVQQWNVAPCSPPPDVVDRVCQAINYACVVYPKRVLCLQRSPVTTCLLRSCGVPARMAMGAQKVPFKAHAWTEVNGRAVNERRNVQQVYMVWERC